MLQLCPAGILAGNQVVFSGAICLDIGTVCHIIVVGNLGINVGGTAATGGTGIASGGPCVFTGCPKHIIPVGNYVQFLLGVGINAGGFSSMITLGTGLVIVAPEHLVILV